MQWQCCLQKFQKVIVSLPSPPPRCTPSPSLSSIFVISIIFLEVSHFGFILFGILWVSGICIFVSFHKLGSFSSNILHIDFLSLSFSSPSWTPMLQISMLDVAPEVWNYPFFLKKKLFFLFSVLLESSLLFCLPDNLILLTQITSVLSNLLLNVSREFF